MSIVFNADYPGTGFVAAERSVQWHLGFAPGAGTADIVETQLSGERMMRRATDRDPTEVSPEMPAEMAGTPDTQTAIRNLLAAYGEDEARDHFDVKGVEPTGRIDSYDIALINPATETTPQPARAAEVSEFSVLHEMPGNSIMSAEDFLLL
ncbi:MAG: hypothetical protein JJ959_04975 [Nisaea sp.]|jgi:hypothetical protein|uniref:hypothetical protein n=1 Tax=Nisaea sp. TaxID=2024842 RepID=UPI001B2CD9D6|nr:hypothetical protein [Nisaea sp.]MBO6559864.1 hypothetical protein [Nisaea sp.]